MSVLKRYNGTAWEVVGGGGSNIPQQPEAPFSPSEDDLWIDTDEAFWPAGAPGSTLAYAEVVSGTVASGIAGTAVDLPNLSVTVTVPAGRRIRIRGQVLANVNNSGDELGNLLIQEGATTLAQGRAVSRVATTNNATFQAEAVVTPSAGTHTYKLQFVREGGTGTWTVPGAAGTYIIVEDITGSSLPYNPASIPVGSLAYGQRTSNQTGIGTTPVLIGGLSVNVSVPSGRQIKITGFLPTFTKTSGAPTWVRAYIRRDGVDVQRTIESANNDTFTALTIEHVESPTAGSHVYEIYCDTDTGTVALDLGSIGAGANAFILVEDVTPTPSVGDGSLGGVLGYSEHVGGGVTVAEAAVIPGLSVTVTVPAGRRIRITAYPHLRSSVATDTIYARIREDGVVKGFAYMNEQAASPNTTIAEQILTPTAGTHTYTVTAHRQAGSGTMSAYGAPGEPAFLLVEDITGTLWPEGSPITTGMITSQPWISYSPVDVNVTVGNGTQVAKYVKIGRTVHFAWSLVFGTTTALGSGAAPGLPVQAASSGVWLCGAYLLDSGVQDYTCNARIQPNGTSARITLGITTGTAITGGGGITGTVPWTWTTNDQIQVSGTYEAAS